MKKYFPELFIFILLFICYLASSPHWVTLEDSGDFIMASYYNGLPHPPGFPLYTILAKIFSLFPFGTIAYRIHTLNCLLGSITGIFVFQIARILYKRNSVALIVALAYGFCQTVWFFSITSEVYALNVFFFAWLLKLALQLSHAWNTRKMSFFALLYGLAISNHWPLMILASPVLFFLLFPDLIQKTKEWPKWAGLFLLGLLPYSYLFVAGKLSEYTFFGPINTWQEFVSYVMREEYTRIPNTFNPDFWEPFRILWFFIGKLLTDFGGFNFFFALFGWGIFVFIRRRWRLGLYFFSSFITTAFLLEVVEHTKFSLAVHDTYIGLQLVPMLIFSLGIGEMIVFILERNKNFFYDKLLIGICVLALLFQVRSSYQVNDLKKDHFAFDFSKIILESLPPRAFLLVAEDADASPLTYANLIGHIRPDISLASQVSVGSPLKIFDHRKDITSEAQAAKMNAFINKTLDSGRRIFTIRRIFAYETPTGMTKNFPFVYTPYGLYFEVSRKPVTVKFDPEVLFKAKRFLDNFYSHQYDGFWMAHRLRMVSNFCLLLTMNQIGHPVIESTPSCLHLKAQWLHVEKKNYALAELYFRKVINMEKDAGNSTIGKNELIRDFMINRLKLLQQFSYSREKRVKMLQEVVDLAYPAIQQKPSCSNQLALNVIELWTQVPIQIDFHFFYDHFYHCEAHQKAFDKAKIKLEGINRFLSAN